MNSINTNIAKTSSVKKCSIDYGSIESNSNLNEHFFRHLFFSVRGSENIHIYFWICKDIGWIFNNDFVGIFFGTSALLWLCVLAYNYYYERDYEQLYFLFPTFLWLFGNYLWMCGNLLFGTDIFRFEASCIMMIGLISIIFYFAFLKNKIFFTSNENESNKYISNGLVCRFKSIGGWRRYEFVHMFFWLLKDYCWCSQDKIMWLGGAIPTIYISFDLVNVTFKNKDLTIDLVHYQAQMIWVMSNIVWAFSELFDLDSDNPPNFANNFDTTFTGRKIACIILLMSFIPIIYLYLIWVPLTIITKINTLENKNNIVIIDNVKNQIFSDIENNT